MSARTDLAAESWETGDFLSFLSYQTYASETSFEKEVEIGTHRRRREELRGGGNLGRREAEEISGGGAREGDLGRRRRRRRS